MIANLLVILAAADWRLTLLALAMIVAVIVLLPGAFQ